jgi:hypothetical protein
VQGWGRQPAEAEGRRVFSEDGVLCSPACEASGRETVGPSKTRKGQPSKSQAARPNGQTDGRARKKVSVKTGAPRIRGCEANKVLRPSGRQQTTKGVSNRQALETKLSVTCQHRTAERSRYGEWGRIVEQTGKRDPSEDGLTR